MSVSILHVRVHAACPCSCRSPCPNCMSVFMLHVHVHAACPCSCCISMFMLHAHVHAACPCSCCMSMFMSNSAGPDPSCISMSMIHGYVHAAYLQYIYTCTDISMYSICRCLCIETWILECRCRH
jgi:hypothetical protein